MRVQGQEGRLGRALLSAEEAAGYFGVEESTIWRWCRQGRIPCLKIGRYWRVRREVLEGFLQEAEDTKGA